MISTPDVGNITTPSVTNNETIAVSLATDTNDIVFVADPRDNLPKVNATVATDYATNSTTTMAIVTKSANATTDDLPEPTEVTSQNYPSPYPGMHTANWRYGVCTQKRVFSVGVSWCLFLGTC